MSEHTTLTAAEKRFSAAVTSFEDAGHGSDDETDALFAMADAGVERAIELTSALSERIDAIAKESASTQIELGAHAKALDKQGELNHEFEGVMTLLLERIAALEKALADLKPCPELTPLEPVTGFITAPSIRIRISHAHTLKDGWRCDSTTVEFDGPLSGFDETVIADHLQMAAVLGAREANLRNAPQPRDAEVPW